MNLGEPESAGQYTEQASVYHVKWKMTWAVAIVHEQSGVLSLVTDHGNWSYRWHRGSLPRGCTFHEFLTRCGADYVLRKVMPDEQRECFDVKGTKDSLREHILESRRHGSLTKEMAREAWDDLSDWDPDDDGSDVPRSVHRAVSDAWECYRMTKTTQALAFMEMWPAIRGLIIKTVDAKKVELTTCPT